ncbi:DUF3750 domain-containing protein [Coralliovum pocilloporae]|uniref:DUF3750 domain-containing protein n=1 Tax=Coralliovum pocilloporae TaxID=3066369 RepID=UPI0033069E76
MILRLLKITLAALFVIWLLPLSLHAALWVTQEQPQSWHAADWSSTGQLPEASTFDKALVQIYAARTGRWRGIFADHTWLVIKDRAANRYERYDVVGWGRPVRRNAYAADGRWYSNQPRLIHAVYGAEAEALIPAIRNAIRSYPHSERGDYTVWPGPNSNTFVSYVIAHTPGLDAALPPTAFGKDFSPRAFEFSPTPSDTGIRLSLGGYFGLSLGWAEGLEVHMAGAVAGVDIRYPAIKLPGFGRIGTELPFQQPTKAGSLAERANAS